MSESKDISLVLGSGGARGIAQIAAIEELTKAGFNITSIAGSSIGAMIGAIYAGGQLEGYKEWLTKLNYWDVFRLMDFSITSKGFIKGEKVFKKIDPFLPKGNIEDLPIPFVAVATDIVNKKSIVLNKGNVREAVRSSISIPTILEPVEKDGTYILDGGIVNPLPVDLVKRNGNDIIVVVDLNAQIAPPKVEISKSSQSVLDDLTNRFMKWRNQESAPKQNLGVFDMLNEAFDLTQDMLAAKILEKNKPQIHIQISRKACGIMDFHKTEEMLIMGKEATKKAIKEYRKELKKIAAET